MKARPDEASYLLLTFDVEDWFQVENFRQYIPFSSWQDCELRVERNTHRILRMLETPERAGAAGPGRPEHGAMAIPKATFFVLGWIAERLPWLIREICARGHEVASHGYHHILCDHTDPGQVRKDLEASKRLLEDITGRPVYGYRAPNFSINAEVLRIVEECGYQYDSSFNSFSIHGRYGHVELSPYRKMGIAAGISDSFYELPVSNLEVWGRVLPWGGGGYFRLIPFRVFKLGIRSILKRQGAYVFYLHPWEVDPDQPRVREASRGFRFRHYVNLRRSLNRLRMLLGEFKWCRFVTCREYLQLGLPGFRD